MELIKRELPENCTIVDTGDWHVGVPASNRDSIEELIDFVGSTKDCYVVLKGDMIDCIPVTDKRFSVASLQGGIITTVQEQAEEIKKLLTPIKDKILTGILGNHEYKEINKYDLMRYWAEELGFQWGGAVCKVIHTRKGKPKWKGLFHHGNGSINSVAKDPIQAEANMKALLKRKLQGLSSDCIIMSMGHTHKLLLVEPTIHKHLHLIDDGVKLKQKYKVDVDQSAQIIDVEARWYANSGSFLNTMAHPGEDLITYSEMAMYPPTQQGYIRYDIRDYEVVKAEKVVL